MLTEEELEQMLAEMIEKEEKVVGESEEMVCIQTHEQK